MELQAEGTPEHELVPGGNGEMQFSPADLEAVRAVEQQQAEQARLDSQLAQQVNSWPARRSSARGTQRTGFAALTTLSPCPVSLSRCRAARQVECSSMPPGQRAGCLSSLHRLLFISRSLHAACAHGPTPLCCSSRHGRNINEAVNPHSDWLCCVAARRWHCRVSAVSSGLRPACANWRCTLKAWQRVQCRLGSQSWDASHSWRA